MIFYVLFLKGGSAVYIFIFYYVSMTFLRFKFVQFEMGAPSSSFAPLKLDLWWQDVFE